MLLRYRSRLGFYFTGKQMCASAVGDCYNLDVQRWRVKLEEATQALLLSDFGTLRKCYFQSTLKSHWV